MEYSVIPGEFKVGDNIVCIDTDDVSNITLGETYVAKFISEAYGRRFVYVDNDSYNQQAYFANRFVLASTIKKEVQLPDLEDSARSLLEECFAFGLNYDTIYRAMQNLQAKTVEAMSK